MLRHSVGVLCVFLAFSLVLHVKVAAYVPAHPTNSSEEAIAGGLNVSDISKLYLRWYSNGYDAQNVSYQLAGSGSQGISEGALVHFSEANVNNTTPPTSTPWIALVSCDFNATNASQQEDIFTLARDNGAVAALLYSLYSLACVINPEYADPTTFDQVFDIFSTQSLTSATLIEYQFGQIGPANESLYSVYNSQRLNDSAAVINATIQTGKPPAPGYLFAILRAYNSTGQIVNSSGGNQSTDASSPQKKQNTGLAMILLYVITGCVTALFFIVIICGVIRAVRNPERYGLRAQPGGGDGSQSRAQGLTRAILDTFPVIKFRSNISIHDRSSDVELQCETDMKIENNRSPSQLKEWETVSIEGHDTLQTKVDSETSVGHSKNPEHCLTTSGLAPDPTPRSDLTSSSSHRAVQPTQQAKVTPASMGRETCPICILDFEEGDDLRVLLCEGKHRFHQSCVDPWLLELSTSCPLCREDFLALENIISGDPPGNRHESEPNHFDRPYSAENRFSRYLRFARRQHHSSSAANPGPSHAVQ